MLLSGKGETTRPMMEKVRGAVFDMLLAHTTGTNVLPAGSRWLDLFAGALLLFMQAALMTAFACMCMLIMVWGLGCSGIDGHILQSCVGLLPTFCM